MALHRVFGGIIIFLSFKCVLTAHISHEGEIWKKGYYPEPSCNNLFPEININDFHEGYFCEKNFVRNDHGKCIPVTNCPLFQTPNRQEYPSHHHAHTCGEGEVWRNEFPPEQTCENLVPELDGYNTREGCFCREDLFRNKNGKCVNFWECPQFAWSGDLLYDESYDEEPISNNFYEPYIDNSYIQPSYAEQSARNWIQEQIAASGRMYDHDLFSDTDVFQREPRITICPHGEYLAVGGIPQRSCSVRSPIQTSARTDCFCENNYLRNAENKCVHETECALKRADETCPNGEKLQYGLLPEATCKERSPERTSFNQTCFCDENMFRNKDNKCVTAAECDQEKRADSACPENEIMTFGQLPERECNNRSPAVTGSGYQCFCEGERLRNKDKKCVNVEECDADKRADSACPENEIMTFGQLPERECNNRSPAVTGSGYQCFCQGDRLRNNDKKCVNVEECDADKRADDGCSENEILSYGQIPEPTCSNRSPAASGQKMQCFCQDNYFRNKDQKCVTEAQCNTEKRADGDCSDNEIMAIGKLPEATCDNRNPVLDDKNVVVQCFCKDNFYRNKDKKCVTEAECNARKRADYYWY